MHNTGVAVGATGATTAIAMVGGVEAALSQRVWSAGPSSVAVPLRLRPPPTGTGTVIQPTGTGRLSSLRVRGYPAYGYGYYAPRRVYYAPRYYYPRRVYSRRVYYGGYPRYNRARYFGPRVVHYRRGYYGYRRYR